MSADWMLLAACRGTDPDAPFASEGSDEEAAFIAVCEGCPVREACLRYALDFDDVGVYGGLTRKQRRLVQAEIAGRKDVAPCGTDRAYHRHRRRGERPCEECRKAHSDQMTQATRRRSEKAPPSDTGRCGTSAGYQAHMGRGQKACAPCAEAAKAYRAQRAARVAG